MTSRKMIGAGSAIMGFGAVAAVAGILHTNSLENARIEARIDGRQEAVQLFSETIAICDSGENEQLCGRHKMDLLLMANGAKFDL